MKTQLLSLAAGTLLSAALFANAHAATPSERWIAESRAALEASINAAGLADDGKAVAITIKAAEDQKGYAPRIVRSSGSTDYDAAVREAVKTVKLGAPPVELRGRGVTFTLGTASAGGASSAGAR